MSQPEQRYELVITATGEVRDEHGNLVEQRATFSASTVLTEDEIKQQIEGNQS